jgi:hypothetical protein
MDPRRLRRAALRGTGAAATLIALMANAACFGGDDNGTPVPPANPPTEAGMADATTPTGDGGATSLAPDAGIAPAAGIYVTNQNDLVTVFALDASGDAPPIRTLVGPSTQLSLPIGVVVDARNNLYVANRAGGSVTMYPATAAGDEAPALGLLANGMGSPQALALGSAGDLFVSTCPGCGMANGGDIGIFHFPSGSGTSDGAITGTNTGLTFPDSIALATNPDGSQQLWVGNAFGGNVTLFASGATGNAAPVASFTPPSANIQSLAYGDGTVFVGVPGAGVDLFPASSMGSATPAATFASNAQLPLQYPAGIFVDSSLPPVVYLDDYQASAVYVIHTAGTAPNLMVASVVTIQGSATMLDGPLGIYVVGQAP